MTTEDAADKHKVKLVKLTYTTIWPGVILVSVDEEHSKEVTSNSADNVIKHLKEETNTETLISEDDKNAHTKAPDEGTGTVKSESKITPNCPECVVEYEKDVRKICGGPGTGSNHAS